MPKILLFDMIDSVPTLSIRDVEEPKPGPGEVRVQVHAIGLNRADIMYMQGGHYTSTVMPTRIGYEAAGIVDSIGPGVTTVRVGDRVNAIPYGDVRYCVGGEFAIAPAHFFVPWPAALSAIEASSAWMQYLTAYFPFKELGKLQSGDFVLVTAASSSAGLGAIQTAKLLGATVLASTRTGAKREALLKAGADHVLTNERGDLTAQILEHTGGHGVRIVYDAVAGPFMNQYAGGVGDHAHIFVYGAMGGVSTIECDILPLIRKGASITLYSLINMLMDPKAATRAVGFVSRALQTGKLRPVVDRVFPLEEAVEAYQYMDTGLQKGKIVLVTRHGLSDMP